MGIDIPDFTTAVFVPQKAESQLWPLVEKIAAIPEGEMAVFTFEGDKGEKDAHNFLAGLQRAAQDSDAKVVKRLVAVGAKQDKDSGQYIETGWTTGSKINRAGETVEGNTYTGGRTVIGVAVVPRKKK